MTLVLHLYELHVCSPLIIVCFVVCVIEKGYPMLGIMIIERSISKVKPMHILSLL